ncbi:Unannotated [Lentimonas sp. CC19]|nr:Unannotated [Lentimonas sp. CC19]CAA6697415.1 Unannotated [Lentimonas sp. CC10]CAA7071344.1 Unannotated [Lentimonas sp. CC11]
MKSSSYRQILCCFLLSLLPHFGVAQSGEKLSFVEGRYCEVVGTDQRSVSFANTLGEHAIEQCASYLRAGSHSFPQRLFVALRPEDRVAFEGDYQIQIGARGQVSLNLRWGADLALETVCRAFAEAYIVRYVNFNYGPDASDKIRYWAVSGLASQCYLSLRPALQGQYIREAREDGVLKIEALLGLDLATAHQSDLSPRDGYWVLYALRKRGLSRTDTGDLLDRAIAGRDVTVTMEALIQPVDVDQQPITLEAWWQSQMANYLTEEPEHYDSMDASQVWLEELAQFDTYRASGGELKNLKELWVHRDDEALRAVIAARREIIAIRIERVNPAYFNAAQSLGALYETTLQSERKFEFIHAFTGYLSDWEDTKRLHEKTHALLDAPK